MHSSKLIYLEGRWEGDYAVSRSTIAGDSKAGSAGSSGVFSGASECAGYRELEPGLLDSLAQEIVNQIRLRGPFLFLSKFVNRQLSSGNPALADTIQSALNEMESKSSTNFNSALTAAIDGPPGKNYASATPPGSAATEYKFPKAAEGICVYGIPGLTRQADILRPIAPILSARDDTFVIRAYGDARDASDRVLARAVCEAVVCRTRNYWDTREAADLATPSTSALNRIFGHRFDIISFRWLSPSEI